MTYDFIAVAIIIVCAVGIVMVILRRLPDMATLDVESIPERREEKLKEKIIAERLRRRFASAGHIVRRLGRPIVAVGKRRVESAYHKVLAIEQSYKKQIESDRPSTADDVNRLSYILQEAEKMVDAEEYKKAEQLYIEALQYDNRNIEAYRGLAEVYIDTKEYQQAEETYKYLVRLSRVVEQELQKTLEKAEHHKDQARQEQTRLKLSSLDHQLATYHFEMGQLYEMWEKIDEAGMQLYKAVQLDANNPRYLDFWLKLSILRGDTVRAREAYERLAEVDPDNKKLPELGNQIADLESGK